MKKNHTILEMLKSFYTYGEKVAVRYFNGTGVLDVTYSKFLQDIQILTKKLLEMQLVMPRVAVLCGNDYYSLVAFFAIVNAGFVSLLVEPKKTSAVVVLDDCECGVILFSKCFRDLAEEVAVRLQKSSVFFCLEEIFEKCEYDGFVQNLGASCRATECCAIFYSSGTTGKSKGVMLSQTNIMFSVNAVNAGFNNVKRTLLILPMHHVAGLVVSVLPALNVGGTVFLGDSFSFVKAVNAFKHDMVVLVPALVEKLSREISLKICNAGCLQYIICSAAPVRPGLVEVFKGYGICVLTAYGLTECSPIVTLGTPRDKKLNTVGKVVEGCQIKLANQSNGVGEIWVCGPNVMLGYHDKTSATKKVLVDGWLRTGDMGFLDEDGFLHVLGRVDNIIVLQSGKKVCPEKLEAQILKLPYVEECLVKPIVQKNENIALAVDLVISQICESDCEVADIYDVVAKSINVLNESLPYYEKIRKINICKQGLEKTTLYKLKR